MPEDKHGFDDSGLHNPDTDPFRHDEDPQVRGSMMEIPDPDPYSAYQNGADSFALLKKVQNKALIGSICGAVSVVIGGMLLAGVGLAFAIVGLVRANKLSGAPIDAGLYRKVRTTTIVAIVICAVAMVLNFVSFVALMPAFMEYIQTGDLAAFYGQLGMGGLSSSTAPTSSTWG